MSLKRKLLAIFIVQNILLVIAAEYFHAPYMFLYPAIFGSIVLLWTFVDTGFTNTDSKLRKLYIGYSIFICALFTLIHSQGLLTSFHKDYHELRSYTGVTASPRIRPGGGTGGGSNSGQIFLNDAEGTQMYFNCNLILSNTCHEEITEYFGVKKQFGQTITVKYAEFTHPLIPFFNPIDRLIYEIFHDGKTTFSYEYFINKFSDERKNLFIFTAFLWISSIGFAVIYSKTK